MRASRRLLGMPLAAATVTLLVAGCGSSGSARHTSSSAPASPSASTPTSSPDTSAAATATATPTATGRRIVTRKGTCEVEVAALVDYNVDAAQTGGDGGAESLGPIIGFQNPVLLAAETVSATVFKQRSTAGATKAISAQCATRHNPVLDANSLGAVKNTVPAADVAVLEHVTITR